MANTFFTRNRFKADFGREMEVAHSVFARRKESGMADLALAVYDFIFISDKESNLVKLGNFLQSNYSYKINEIKESEEYWELRGASIEFPVNEDNLMFWALDMYCKGYEFDSELDGYGAEGDSQNQKFPDIQTKDADHYFELAMDAYNKRNLSMAIIHFSTAIQINPNDPNSWYSRAILKDELHTWKAARRDYDKAIELAPDFVDAIINRAANKDEAGEYYEAIQDYNTAIELDPQNEMAYFNRGNSKLNVKDRRGACEDWTKARELGADYAQERMDKYCI